MSPQELEAWLADLCARAGQVAGGFEYDNNQAGAWIAEAATALASAFPAGHPVRLKFSATTEQRGQFGLAVPPGTASLFDAARGTVKAALDIVKAGRLTSIIDGVRAETVGEVLDQAEALLGNGHLIAAAVLAGGALETHLAHLCGRSRLSVAGAGSIEKYNSAIGEARNKGTASVYDANDGKSVTAWGGIRNEAAHTPVAFARTKEEVRLMLQGVRQFISRMP